MKKIFSTFFVFIFFIPVFAFLFKIEIFELPESNDWILSLVWTFAQSFASATLSLGLGVIAAFGLDAVTNSKKKLIWQVIALLPGFLPQIIVLTSLFSISSWFGLELRGFVSIVFIHTLMNVGICAVAVELLLKSRIRAQLNLCQIEGVSFLSFLKKVFFPLLQRELLAIWLLVFCFCLTSFGVPLLVANSQLSFEVLIYETIKIRNQWGVGILLGFIQMALVFLFAMVLMRKLPQNKQTLSFSDTGYHLKCGQWILLICSVISIVGLLTGVFSLFVDWSVIAQVNWKPELIQSIYGTLSICIMTFVFTFILFSALSFLYPLNSMDRFFIVFLPPSAVVFGFGLWIIGSNEFFMPYLKISIGLCLIFFPALYRWRGSQILMGLQGQFEMARVLGASRFQIFQTIIFPQSRPVFFWLSGVAAFWAAGDFALSSILNFGTYSLGLFNESLVSSYQFELASLVSILTIGIGIIFFLFGGWLSHVFDPKP